MKRVLIIASALSALVAFGFAYAAPTITISGHTKLAGTSQLGGTSTSYVVPTISGTSAGTPGVTTVSVKWKTNVPATSQVVYGPTSSYGSSTSSASLIGTHAMTIFGLTASSTYHYAVVSTNALGKTSTSSDKTFNTSSWPAVGFNSGGEGYYFNNFTFLSDADLAYMQKNGVSTIRTMICWEQMQPTLNESLNSTYLNALKAFMADAATHDITTLIDIHNYARYRSTGALDGSNNLIGNPSQCLQNSVGYIIGSAQVPASSFANFWGQLSAALMNQPGLAGYELMNEPHDMGNLTLWPVDAEAAIGAIRAVDATTSIYVSGNLWDVAQGWIANNPSFPLTNPDDTNIVYTAHAYFDAGGGGSYTYSYNQTPGAYSNSAVDALKQFVGWANQYSLKGAITEMGVPYNDPRWILVMKNAINYLKANNMLAIIHYYDSNQPGYEAGWPITTPPVSLLNAAPVNAAGQLIATSTTPLMVLTSQFDLGN